MELYKFINETTVKKYGGGFIILDNRVYVNPLEETVKKAGYKPMIREDYQYDITKEYPEITYMEREKEIVQKVVIRKFDM